MTGEIYERKADFTAKGDMIYKVDVEGFYIYANERTADFLQTPAKTLYSTTFDRFVRKDWLDNVVEFYSQQINDKTDSSYFEFPIIKPDGKEAWVGQSLEVVSDGYKITELVVVARDITERVYASNLLKSHEEKYREIIENIDLGLMEVDLEENIVFANDSFCRSMGYKFEDIVGRKASEVFLGTGDSYREEVDQQNNLRSQGYSSVYEMKMQKKNGDYIWMTISGAPVKSADGSVIGSIGIHHDITDRKIKEIERKKLLRLMEEQNAELRKNQLYLKGINEFASSLITCNDVESVVKQITDNTIDKFGLVDCVVYLLDEEKSVLTQISAYGPKKSAEGVKNPITIPVGVGIVGNVALTGQPERVNDTSNDSRYIQDDDFRLSELAVPMIVNDEVIGVIDSEHPQKDFYTDQHLALLSTIANLAATKIKNNLVQDIKRSAEIAIKESESKLRLIINSSLDAVITINDRGLVTEWNPQAEELFLFSKEEAIGASLSNLIVPPSYREAHAMGMKNYRKTGQTKVSNKRIEIVGCNKNGTEFPIELTIVPVETKGQRFFSAFIRDITVRKKAEDDMQAALQKQKELNEMKSNFVSMTSHEFRTPLTTIQTNIDLLSFQLDSQRLDNRPKLDKSFTRITSEIDRLTNLMNDILMIGRIENGKIPFKPMPTDLSKLSSEVITDTFSHRSDGRQVEFITEGNHRNCLIDPNIYTHIITNLLSNAFKYSPFADSPILKLKYSDRFVSVEVRDFGIGIPENDIPQLFDSFYRARNVENIQGTGLGLAIVKEFLQMHQAQITVTSEINKGTCFTITQPA